jgi:RNA polymerase I-specific transcription initiation factor RRN7
LSLLPSSPSPEPLLHEQATLGDVDVHGEKASPDRAGASSPEGDDIEGDSEIDEMLRALSESSSSEDEKDDDTGEPRLKPEGAGRKSGPFGCHGPTSNIALLMVACWTLRLPVMYLDLIRFGYRVEAACLADM